MARTEDVVVAVAPIFAYPNGLRLELKAFPRTAPEDPDRFYEAFAPGLRGDPAGRLRFGVEYPDGSKATRDRRTALPDFDSGKLPDEPVLFPTAAVGGAAPTAAFWLWPLPVGGVDFVVEWPYQEVPESRARLDGAAVREAAAAAHDVWD